MAIPPTRTPVPRAPEFSFGPLREESLWLLLQMLVAAARRAKETPLDFEAAHLGIARAAWMKFRSEASSDQRRALLRIGALGAELDLAVVTILNDAPQSENGPEACSSAAAARSHFAAPPQAPPHGGEGCEEGIVRELATWLDRARTVVGNVDAQAWDVLALRLEGCGDREIAQRLGLGRRLVQRLVADMQTAWNEE